MTYYYIYQITNMVNSKIYVGVHKTRNLDDGYMGSGKIIRSAIAKHGISNFSKVILEFFDTSEAMYAREKEIITEEFLSREDTYNLRRGGYGGFDYLTNHPNRHVWSNNGGKTAKENRKGMFSDEGLAKAKTKETRDKITTTKRLRSDFKKETEALKNARIKAAGSESVAKRKNTFSKICHQQGSKNSQYNTMWITDGITTKKILKDEHIPIGFFKGRKIS